MPNKKHHGRDQSVREQTALAVQPELCMTMMYITQANKVGVQRFLPAMYLFIGARRTPKLYVTRGTLRPRAGMPYGQFAKCLQDTKCRMCAGYVTINHNGPARGPPGISEKRHYVRSKEVHAAKIIKVQENRKSPGYGPCRNAISCSVRQVDIHDYRRRRQDRRWVARSEVTAIPGRVNNIG